MNLNKSMIIILVLTSLLISAIGSAVYLYFEKEESKNLSNELITIFIAGKLIKKNEKVEKTDIKKRVIAKKYLLDKPMLLKEIVGKIAKSDIYENEMFRKDKLITKLEKEESTLLEFIYNSCNISFELFENPNYNLVKGDYINIISVYPANTNKSTLDYKVNYVAKNIRVLGFLEKGKAVETTFRTSKKSMVDKKTKKKKIVTKEYYADEVLLDVKSDILLRLIDDYNKGKQLWMIKTKKPKEKKVEVVKEKIEEEPILTKTQESELNKEIESKQENQKVLEKESKKENIIASYPKTWYQPRPVKLTQEAVIYYSDNKSATKSVKNSIEIDYVKECSQRENVLIGVANKVNLRSVASFRGKVKRIVKRNYLIPYIRQVDDDWYETCDKKYVHKNEAKPHRVTETEKLAN
jgi:hypothetical protein